MMRRWHVPVEQRQRLMVECVAFWFVDGLLLGQTPRLRLRLQVRQLAEGCNRFPAMVSAVIGLGWDLWW